MSRALGLGLSPCGAEGARLPIASPDAALTWPHPLHAFQRAGIARLLASDSMLLADEMGLGKTIQAIAALRILMRRGEARSALVVVPAGLLLPWRAQFRAWAPNLTLATVIGRAEQRISAWMAGAQIHLVGFEALRHDRVLSAPFGPAKRVWDVVIADEAQRLKNADSELALAVRSLKRRRIWALTGTPVENRARDAASILDIVAPGQFDRAEMMPGLRRALGSVQLRRRRAEVLPNLPPKTGEVIAVPLGAAQRAAYDRARDEGLVWLRSRGANVRASHVLELILRLKQICNADPEHGGSAKADDLALRLRAVARAGEKSLVFSQFTTETFGVAMLADRLADLHPVVLSGGMSAQARAAAVARFERDERRAVMVLSLRAGGIGLNLTAASAVFHFDRWWNPAQEAQAEDRAHRMGQTRPVRTFTYLTPDTVEERIDAILNAKRGLFADLVDGVSLPVLARLDLLTLLHIVNT